MMQRTMPHTRSISGTPDLPELSPARKSQQRGTSSKDLLGTRRYLPMDDDSVGLQ